MDPSLIDNLDIVHNPYSRLRLRGIRAWIPKRSLALMALCCLCLVAQHDGNTVMVLV